MRQIPYQFRYFKEVTQKEEYQQWRDNEGNGGPEEAFESFNDPNPKKLKQNLYWMEKFLPTNNCTEEDLTNGKLLDNYHFITRIGIQSTPGVKFTLNDNPNWIEIGATGIYELDLTGIGIIKSIKFDNSPNTGWGKMLPTRDNFCVLIDIIYKDTSTGDEAL